MIYTVNVFYHMELLIAMVLHIISEFMVYFLAFFRLENTPETNPKIKTKLLD